MAKNYDQGYKDGYEAREREIVRCVECVKKYRAGCPLFFSREVYYRPPFTGDFYCACGDRGKE